MSELPFTREALGNPTDDEGSPTGAGSFLLRVRAAPGVFRRDLARSSRTFKAWILLLLAGCAVGAVTAVLAWPAGWEVMGTTPTVEWGLLIVGYAAFAVTTSGLCLTSSLGTVFGIDRFRPLERRHAILAILCLVTAFGIIALDLHWPIRMVFGVVLSPAPSSPMWWMGVAYGTYLLVLVVEIWSMFTHRPRLHQWVCTMAAVMAIIAPSTLGAVFGVLTNRPLWHGPASSLSMLATAVLSGCALLCAVFATVERLELRGAEFAERAIRGLRVVLFGALLVSGAFVARQIVSGYTSSEPGMRGAIEAIVFGPLAGVYWAGRIGLGLFTPLFLLLVPLGVTRFPFFLASVLTLVGVFTDRTLFVVGGLLAPTSSSVGGVVPAGGIASYVPSPVELGIIGGGIALVALVYTFVERYVDLGTFDPHVGFSFRSIRAWRAARASSRDRAADETGAPA